MTRYISLKTDIMTDQFFVELNVHIGRDIIIISRSQDMFFFDPLTKSFMQDHPSESNGETHLLVGQWRLSLMAHTIYSAVPL